MKEDASRAQHKRRLEELLSATRQKVQYHRQKPYLETVELYGLIRGFILSLLEKEYEATYEELADEIASCDHEFISFSDEQLARARKLLERLSYIEYADAPSDQEELKSLLDEFHDLSAELATFEEESIEQALHRGFLFLRKGDKAKAKEAYLRARTLFERLGEHANDAHRQELEQLYARLNQ